MWNFLSGQVCCLEDRREGVFCHNLSQSVSDLRLKAELLIFESAMSALLMAGARMETRTGPAWEEAIATALLNACEERFNSSWIDSQMADLGLSFDMSVARLSISLDLLTAVDTPG